MTMSAMMPGPDRDPVKCYRRHARNVQSGDFLPEYGTYVAGAPITDPDDGAVWVTTVDGRDIRHTPRGKVWVYRQYAAPDWMAAAVQNYRDARHAWESLRESGVPVSSGAVAGAAGAVVTPCQLEEDDYRRAFPAPRLADYIRDAAAARREES